MVAMAVEAVATFALKASQVLIMFGFLYNSMAIQK
jgi:hypothetical protein